MARSQLRRQVLDAARARSHQGLDPPKPAGVIQTEVQELLRRAPSRAPKHNS